MKRLLALLGLAVALLAALMLARTLLTRPGVDAVTPAPELELDARRVCERLGRALQIPSVSRLEPSVLDEARLERMADFVVESFPPVLENLQLERHPRCLVWRWAGSQSELEPLLLLAHLDVVPVEPRTLESWSFPPFSGEIAAGYVWGRGALDDKATALAMLEAVELLLSEGFRPRRAVILCFGLDEELGGNEGARAQAQRFADEGLRPHLILDEGYAVLEGVLDVVASPIAAVGVAEKGQLTLELRVRADGGHASMPEAQTSLGILAGAIAALERNPMPARLDGAPALFCDELAREMSFGQRFLFANRWITEPLLRRALLAKAGSAALVRTTTAVTTANAGVAPNVLPEEARATVNFRIHPRDDVAAVLERVRAVIDDERVELVVLGEAVEPSPTSPARGEAWELLERTIRECYPGVIVAPSLVVGATDARHYAALCPNVYRFTGLRLGPEDLERIHGVNERISTKNYLELIRFYRRLIQNG
jgi:carboxypeptidase PM20D1